MGLETDKDIAVALAAGELFNKRFLNGSGKLYHFQRYSPIDLAIRYYHHGSVYNYLLEHKNRSVSRFHYSTIWLSLQKYHFLTFLPLNSIPIFIVTWTDCVGVINLNNIRPVRTTIDHRRRGNRAIDTDEILVEFDVHDFTIL